MSLVLRVKFFIYRTLASKWDGKNIPTDFGVKLRRFLLKDVINSVGKNVNFQPQVRIKGDLKRLSIGDNSGIGFASSLHLNDEVIIGNDVMIGERLTIHTSNHGTKLGELIRLQESINQGVTIGDNVWIGSNVTLLAGVNIGSGAVIGSGSIVTKDVLPNVIVAGNPAKLIRERV